MRKYEYSEQQAVDWRRARANCNRNDELKILTRLKEYDPFPNIPEVSLYSIATGETAVQGLKINFQTAYCEGGSTMNNMIGTAYTTAVKCTEKVFEIQWRCKCACEYSHIIPTLLLDTAPTNGGRKKRLLVS